MAQIANRLTQLTIKFISLVPAGANRREVIAKADGSFDFAADIKHVDKDRRWATSVVYPIGEVDTQGDFMTEADFDLAMADFMAKGRTASNVATDVNHDERPTPDFFVEAWKIREGDPLFPNDVGAWAVTRQITDDALWEQVKSGEMKAFSFGGTAVRIPDQAVTKSRQQADIKRGAATLIDSIRKGPIADILSRMTVPNLIEAATRAMWDAYYQSPANTEDEKARVAEIAAELTAELSKESTMQIDPEAKKGLMKQFGELVDKVFGLKPASTDAATDEPTTEPTAEEQVEAAKAALQAEHETAIEALKAEHGEQIEALKAEIEELKKAAPPSAVGTHQNTNHDDATGGLFAGRAA